MKIKYIIGRFLLLLLVTVSTNVEAQTDANVCHFWTDREQFNPAYLVPMTHASVICRKQQAGYKGQPFTAWANFSQYKPKIRSLFGANVHFDMAGYTYVTKANLTYVYSLGSDNDRINLGVSTGLSLMGYDESKVKVDNTADVYAYEDKRVFSPNFNVGTEWIRKVGRKSESDEMTLGVSILNFEDWILRRDLRATISALYLYGSYRYRTIKMLDIYGGMMFQVYDLNRAEGELHCSVIKVKHDGGDLDILDLWSVGVSYRHNLIGGGSSDLVLNAGIACGSHIYIGYSFDLVLHGDFARPFSSHELIVEFKFKDRGCYTFKDTYKMYGGK